MNESNNYQSSVSRIWQLILKRMILTPSISNVPEILLAVIKKILDPSWSLFKFHNRITNKGAETFMITREIRNIMK